MRLGTSRVQTPSAAGRRLLNFPLCRKPAALRHEVRDRAASLLRHRKPSGEPFGQAPRWTPANARGFQPTRLDRFPDWAKRAGHAGHGSARSVKLQGTLRGGRSPCGTHLPCYAVPLDLGDCRRRSVDCCDPEPSSIMGLADVDLPHGKTRPPRWEVTRSTVQWEPFPPEEVLGPEALQRRMGVVYCSNHPEKVGTGRAIGLHRDGDSLSYGNPTCGGLTWGRLR